jgi:hypothetical protein
MRNHNRMVIDYFWVRALGSETALEYQYWMAKAKLALAEAICG